MRAMIPSQRHSLASLLIPLSLTAFAPSALAQTTRLTPAVAPSGGTVRVAPGAAPAPADSTITPGGAIEHPGCGGFVSARPNLVINATGDVPWLRVYASATSDTALAILTPNNQWRCADDTYGANPSIDGRFRRGLYRVWVASPQPGSFGSATVTVTAQRAQRPSDTPLTTDLRPTPQDTLNAATGLAQQVLGGFTGNGTAPATTPSNAPLAVPLATLSRAGLSPATLPPALDSVLRRPDAGATNLTPAQLTQLAELARSGMSADQLAPVMGALTSASAQQGTLNPTQLTQLSQLARGGATPQALQTALSSMLRSAGAAH